MAKEHWNKAEKKAYFCLFCVGVAGITIMSIAYLIEACRSRPKVIVLGLHGKPDPEKVKSESSSAEK